MGPGLLRGFAEAQSLQKRRLGAREDVAVG
jgi:hypothetical protein